MAAPPEKTMKSLTGKWKLNKDLSGNTDPLLALQGIGYLTRKGIGLATVHIDVNQYEAPPKPPSTETAPVVHIDIDQTAAGLAGTQENRCTDGVYRPHSDWLFGNVNAKSEWVSLDDLTDEHLKSDYLVEAPGTKEFLLNTVEADAGWTAQQTWGFQTVNGERRYVRNVLVKKGDKRESIKMIYDYVS